ncbi:MAG: FmdE family protein [Vulcanibacillus sp.]
MNQLLWEKCVEFHGHQCPGLAIGFKACEAAKKEMNLKFSRDEEVVCITENNACGVDAIQVLTGCSFGKGNLIYKPNGKMAFTFFSRKTGEKMRFVLNDLSNDMDRETKINYLLDSNTSSIFVIKQTDLDLPKKAKIYNSIKCNLCGETTAEPFTRIMDGNIVCLDCFS